MDVKTRRNIIKRATLSPSLMMLAFCMSMPAPAHAGPEDATTPVKFFSGSRRREAVVERPEQQSFRLNEEGVELIFQGKREEGKKRIEQALKYDARNPTALYNLAGLELANSRPKEAIRLMQTALTIRPDDLAFLNRLAESHFADSDIPLAISSYESIVRRDPTFGEAMSRLGTLYGMQREWEKAEDTLRKAVAVHPKDAQALSNLGNTLVLREKFDEAIATLRRAQELGATPGNAVALGIAYEALGDPAKALEQYREAKKLGDKDEQLTQHIKEMEKGPKSRENSTAIQ